MRHLKLLALLPLLSAPAWAAETAWQEVAPGVKLRLISTGERQPDGTAMLGLELDMPAATKTYWRVPGDTGLPTRLDWTGSTGVEGHQILWPYPTRSQTGDYLDYVYFGPTILPIEVALKGEAPVARVSATLGICSDICMPAQASFSLDLGDNRPDRANGLRIRQALATTPAAWDGKADAFARLEFQADSDALWVWIADPSIDPTSLIAATASGEPHFGTPLKGPEPGLFLLPVLGTHAADLREQAVQLTFMTERGAYMVTQTMEPARAP
ncbi:MAG: hypothetical protein JWR39_2332 [Devosia sp.]|nr:hypothetical protein [Devosia sp.]